MPLLQLHRDMNHDSFPKCLCGASEITPELLPWHVHLIKTKYYEDARPGQHVEAAPRQYADLCKNRCGKAVTLHTILLGIGETCCDEQRSSKEKKRKEKSTQSRGRVHQGKNP
eukprot:161893-Pelagomonas_calceolata.AAC.1